MAPIYDRHDENMKSSHLLPNNGEGGLADKLLVLAYMMRNSHLVDEKMRTMREFSPEKSQCWNYLKSGY